MTTNTPIRIGLLGAGIFAREQHVPALLADGRFSIKAVYSRTEETAQKLVDLLRRPATSALPPDITQDQAELLARDDIDAVVIALPIQALPAAVRAALDSGKHILSEKPIAPTTEVGRDLLAAYAARQTDQVWMVGENYRYEEAYIKAGELINEGAIGRVFLADWAVYIPLNESSKYYHTAWRHEAGIPGGFVLDGGVHHVAGMRAVLGEVASVTATTAHYRSDLTAPDTLTANLTFDSGALAAYSVTYAAGSPWYGNLQVVGEKGALRTSRVDALELTVGGDMQSIPIAALQGVPGEVGAFADAILEGIPHRNTPEQALQDVAVVEAMLQAAATGEKVTPERFV